MQIRAATPAESTAIADLWLDFMKDQNRRFLKTVRLTRANRDQMADHLAKLAGHGQVLVVEAEGAIVGFSAVVVDLPRLELFYASASLSDLYLVPSARGRGWGRKLLDATVKMAAARGVHGLNITAAAGNDAALSLYASYGFRPKTETLMLPLDSDFLAYGKEAP